MIDSIQNENNKWIHITSPSPSDIRYLADTYRFHSLDLEDISSEVERPRIDLYPNYYFMVTHYPYLLSDKVTIKTAELDLFWGKDFLITISHSKSLLIPKLFDSIRQNREKTEEYLSNSSTWMLYQIFDHIFANSSKIIKANSKLIEKINNALFDTKKSTKTIEDISKVRTNSILLNTMFKPQLTIFKKLETGVYKGFDPDMSIYWSDTADSIRRIWDIIEDHQELIEGLSATFDSLISNRTNEVMKILTFFSAILLPLTFVAGIYGMNIPLPFQSQFIDNPLPFISILSGMIIVVIIMIIFFKIKKWM